MGEPMTNKTPRERTIEKIATKLAELDGVDLGWFIKQHELDPILQDMPIHLPHILERQPDL
jgi:hypothetical protein